MPYGAVFTPAVTTPHIHSTGAGQGGQLSTADTRITNFSPISLVLALG